MLFSPMELTDFYLTKYLQTLLTALELSDADTEIGADEAFHELRSVNEVFDD